VPAFERSAEPNPNANTANAITKLFFPMIKYSSRCFGDLTRRWVRSCRGKFTRMFLARTNIDLHACTFLREAGSLPNPDRDSFGQSRRLRLARTSW